MQILRHTIRAGIVLALGGFIGLLAGGCSGRISDRDIVVVGIGDVQSLRDRETQRPGTLLLIDPRSERSFEEAHIPGAANLRLSDVDTRFGRDPAIEGYDHIVVYGEDPGSASAKGMTKRLMSVGYRRVRMFAGGLHEWRRAGLPLAEGDGN